VLSNPIYVGEIRHKDLCHPGQHEPILDRELWERTQQQLRERTVRNDTRQARLGTSPLTDDCSTRTVTASRRATHAKATGAIVTTCRGIFSLTRPGNRLAVGACPPGRSKTASQQPCEKCLTMRHQFYTPPKTRMPTRPELTGYFRQRALGAVSFKRKLKRRPLLQFWWIAWTSNATACGFRSSCRWQLLRHLTPGFQSGSFLRGSFRF
jgi:hypothetical protein